MNVLTFLYATFIYPLELVFEAIFALSEKAIHNPALSIIVLSMAVNFLALPLYRRADIMQAEERAQEKKMEKWVAHIKRTFKGDERFMMLRHYYSLEGYKPVYVLKSSIPLLLQVPFFIAAYHFLANLNYLNNVKLGPISSLGSPDELLFGINVLPIIMTLINIVSSSIYAKDMPLKSKVQMYGLAAVFLILLYDSPSGLVFYWTINNIFSLAKNVVDRFIKHRDNTINRIHIEPRKEDGLIFLFGSISMAAITGLLIPSATVSASPLDFVSLSNYINPMLLVVRSATTAIGIFVVWTGVYYVLMTKENRSIFALAITVINLWVLWDYFLLDRPKVGLSATFIYNWDAHSSTTASITNVLVMVLVAVLMTIIWRYRRDFIIYALLLTIIAYGFMSVQNITSIHNRVKEEYFLSDAYATEASFNLSTEGQNVVVIMLDRAIGCYFQYAIDTYPELMTDFTGFTYYPNCLSHGKDTIFGASSIWGGPEYTAPSMQRRLDMSMEDKTNEALLMLPVLFQNNGYDITVINPPFAGFDWIPDVRLYEPYGIDMYYPADAYSHTYRGYDDHADAVRIRQERNLFCYGLTRITPAFMFDLVYDNGNYNAVEYGAGNSWFGNMYYCNYINAFSEIDNFSGMTQVVNDNSNNYVAIENNLTHEDIQLNDNTYLQGVHRGDNDLLLDSVDRVAHWQINITAYHELINWFEYLKSEGVYDNTRIIIVSDHGMGLGQESGMVFENGVDLQSYNALLLFKDFDQTGFTINNELITNAAVPYLATQGGVVDNNVNPFTDNQITLEDVSDGVTIIESPYVMPSDHRGSTYNGATWYRVVGTDIYNMDIESTEVQ